MKKKNALPALVQLFLLGLCRSLFLGGFLGYAWNMYGGWRAVSFGEGVAAGLVLQVIGSLFQRPKERIRDEDWEDELDWSVTISVSSSAAILLSWALLAVLAIMR